MKIERVFIPTSTLKAFCEKHDLTVLVTERDSETVAMDHVGPNARFYAEIKDAELKDGTFLRSCFGDGRDEHDSIKALARRISERTLVFRAYHDDRTEIDVPRLVEEA